MQLLRPRGVSLLSSLCTTMCVATLFMAGAVLCHPVEAQRSTSRAPALVFDGVTVIDVETGAERPAQRVVITGTRITAIGSAKTVAVPKHARVVNARGKYLIPGMWDMHVHPRKYAADIAFPLLIANGVTGVRDAGTNVPLATIAQWKREVVAGTRVGPRYLVSGPMIQEGATKIEAGNTPYDDHYVDIPVALARYAMDSLHAAGADFIKIYGGSPAYWFVMAAEARRAGMLVGGHLPSTVNLRLRDDEPWMETPVGDSSAIHGPEASDSGATFLDHSTWGLGTHCLRYRTDSLGHQHLLDSLAAVRCYEAAEVAAAQQFRRNNTWIPIYAEGSSEKRRNRTMALLRRYLPASRYRRGISPDSAARLDTADAKLLAAVPTSTAEWRADTKKIPGWRIVSNEGVCDTQVLGAGTRPLPQLVGSDFSIGFSWLDGFGPPGFVVPITLVCFVIDGMTPFEALQAATLNPARALRATDSLGTVARGKLADLVLLDADPLQDIWNTSKVRAVVANGRYFDRAALDQLLRDVEARAKQE